MPTELLSATELGNAIKLNRYWSKKLGAAFPSIEALGNAIIPNPLLGDETFAHAVAGFQAAHNLHIDGVLGPKTAAVINGGTWVEPPAATGIVVKNKTYPTSTAAKVLNWKDTGLSFGRGRGLVYTRNLPVEMGVLHTTGGEGSGHQVWNTLVARNLSVDGLLDSDGTFYQYSDPGLFATAHAGWANAVSWGIEITDDLNPHAGKVKRPLITGTLSGQPHEWDGLLEPQRAALPSIVDAFCEAFNIPRQIPGKNGKVIDGPPVPHDLVQAYRVAKKAKDKAQQTALAKQAEAIMRPLFEGCVIGHWMCSLSGKPDPCPDCFEVLLAAGYTIKEI